MLDVEKLIEDNQNFILENIDFAKNEINVHINSMHGTDFPRCFFILFTLSRLYKNNKLKVSKEKVLPLFWEIYKKAKEGLGINWKGIENMRYVDLYGMRALQNFGEDFSVLLESFKTGDHASIFVYPVITYLFVSTYLEVNLKNNYPYSESIFLESLKIFDAWVYSTYGDKYWPFHFAEISHWVKFNNSFIDKNFIADADKKMQNNWQKFLSIRPNSSGIAKCLEHFGRIGDKEKINEIFTFLENRKIGKYKNYTNPNFLKFSECYVEEEKSQYISLDTNAHIIHALLNTYEKS